MEQQERYTVITGASSGIGRDAARIFAEREKNLILVARRMERLEELKQELIQKNGNLHVVLTPCDLTDSAQVYDLYENLREYEIETWSKNAGQDSGAGCHKNRICQHFQ